MALELRDEDLLDREVLRRGPVPRTWLLLGVVALLGAALYHRGPLLRALEPAPAPYDPAQAALWRAFMRDALTDFVIAADAYDRAAFPKQAEAFVSAARFDDGLARRVEEIAEAIASFDRTVEAMGAAARREQVRGRLIGIETALEHLEEDLRRMDAPFDIDWQLSALKRYGRWTASIVIRSSEIVAASEFEAAGQPYRVLRVRRLDRLALEDLAHGIARNGVARAHVEPLRELLLGHYLPLLAPKGELRDFGDSTRAPAPFALALRAELLGQLPARLHDSAVRVGALAAERRRVLEAVDRELRRGGTRLIQPAEFFLDTALSTRLQSRVGRRNAAAIARFTVGSEVDRAEGEACAAVAAAVFELVARGTERHEAWHLALPEPQRVGGEGHPRSDAELVAYLGMLADAEGELAVVSYRLRRAMAVRLEGEIRSATDAAILAMAEIWPAMPEVPKGADAVEIWRTAWRAEQRLAKRLLREWFGEERRMRRQI